VLGQVEAGGGADVADEEAGVEVPGRRTDCKSIGGGAYTRQ
jgi:hypothetical protein